MTISRNLGSVLLALESGNSGGYCWDPSWVRQGESWWSIIHKWAQANAATIVDISVLVGPPSPNRRANTLELRHGLIDDQPIDKRRAANLFQLTEEMINAARVFHYLIDGETRLIFGEALRFCPVCIKFGYHCAAFQTAYIGTCPIHGVRLITNCIKCGEIASPYNITAIAIRNAYSCEHCATPLWSGSSPHDRDQRLVNKDPTFLFEHPAIQWLIQRRKHTVVAHNWSEWSGIGKYERIKSDAHMALKIHAMIQVWNKLNGFAFPGVHAKSWRGRWDFVTGYRSFPLPTKGAESEDVPDLIPVYKRIRNFILRTQIGMTSEKASNVLDEYLPSRASGARPNGSICRGRKFYLLLRAYSKWRMFWEKKTDPHKLTYHRGRYGHGLKSRLPISQNIRTLAKSFPSAARTVLTIDCASSFLSAVSMAACDGNVGVCHGSYGMEKAHCYWVAIRDESTKIITIHWAAPVHSNYLKPPFVFSRA